MRRILWVLLALGSCATLACFFGACRALFYPPEIELREAYADSTGTAQFDHSGFDAVLRRRVGPGGVVDYAALHAEPAALDEYIRSLAEAPFEDLSRDGKLALLCNAYNAFTLRLIIDHWPVASIKDIPSGARWEAERWVLAGRTLSLNALEHQEVRGHFADARIHFVLVCAARGCPPLRGEAYTAAKLESQFEDQATLVHSDPRWFEFDRDAGLVQLTQLYDWYRGDFVQDAGSVLAFASRHAAELAAARTADEDVEVSYLDYDWSLNGR